MAPPGGYTVTLSKRVDVVVTDRDGGSRTIENVELPMPGKHNIQNALAALVVVDRLGVSLADALAALASFTGASRRFEVRGSAGGVTVVGDYAHHPTAIRLTLEGLRRNVGNARVLVALEPRSNTMRAGVHIDELGPALIAADRVWLMAGDGIDWDPQEALAPLDAADRAAAAGG